MLKVRSRVDVKLSNYGGVTGEFISFDGFENNAEHVAIKLGPDVDVPLVRLHSECFTGDTFGSTRCDCGEQLAFAIKEINQHGGYLLYLKQEGRGIGLNNKLAAYELQDQGMDTYEANMHLGLPEDGRNYDEAIAMLETLGINQVRLITNNPKKVAALEESSIHVTEVMNTAPTIFAENQKYILSKREKGKHAFKPNEE